MALYIGLSADSGNFRYDKTSMRTHLAGGDLIGYGIPTDRIYRLLYEDQPVDRLHFIRRVLGSLVVNKELKYVLGEVRPKMTKGLELGGSFKEGLVNLFMAVRGIRLAALMSQTEKGYLKCSLRSIEDINVVEIASLFGGGGHRNAAGFMIEEPYRKAKKKVAQAIHDHLTNHE